MYKHVERMKQRDKKTEKYYIYKECAPNKYQSTIANKTKAKMCVECKNRRNKRKM